MKTIYIDGSLGEGGGQVLRSSLSLSMITGRPFRIEKIRAKRSKPGLMRQHLTCVRAAAEICGAEVEGDELKSQAVSFVPGKVQSGEYRFAVGTAGSTSLVFQTIFLPLLLASGDSIVQFEGGTHNSKAPSFDYLAKAFLPLIRKMGAEVDIELVRAGFYPAGQGQFVAEIRSIDSLSPIQILNRGELKARIAEAGLCNLDERIGKRELSKLAKALDLNLSEMKVRQYEGSAGVGNVLSLTYDFDELSEVFTGFGEKGITAEFVARGVSKEALRYIKEDAPVGDYLADQLLLPFALAGGGSFRTLALSQHFLTNKNIIETFLDVEIVTTRQSRLSWLVEIRNG
ncbi:RNA 3'-terminal phosphate cyclase [Pelagicoccus sp. SDUM812003]|uniref:RNA 3'-terminal phosphate cyclase n=1 Tax=Pelagicoccus sp. SDUM812003 TaxID=3041267 RepID=UPI002810806F|nr:RNA 3'-terminal phosphate cyclase [Pelagicoccus sp. SDUM812003]MDQ8205664.1 RNA 3'-terminal phosphate cyclase [Pelagicoccus sp. SDUM812003]